MSKSTKEGSKISVRQFRSAAGYDKRTKAVLSALGLGRIGKQKSFTTNPALLGQIARVSHLIEVVKS